MNIPHNILVADEGMTLYIIPRKFDLLIENVNFFTSFESLCGFVKFKTQDAYDKVDFSMLSHQMADCVSLSDTDFSRMKSELVQKFLQEYEGQSVNWK